MELCRYLRWKGFYGRDWADGVGLQAALDESDVPFSCLKTCEAWGPDDSPAAPETCGSHRSCYRESELLRTLT